MAGIAEGQIGDGRRPSVKAHTIYFVWAGAIVAVGGLIHLLTRLS